MKTANWGRKTSGNPRQSLSRAITLREEVMYAIRAFH